MKTILLLLITIVSFIGMVISFIVLYFLWWKAKKEDKLKSEIIEDSTEINELMYSAMVYSKN